MERSRDRVGSGSYHFQQVSIGATRQILESKRQRGYFPD
ncbi:MAG: hypothetical protein RLZZ142_2194 [Verrucomicrobiota bacterium]